MISLEDRNFVKHLASPAFFAGAASHLIGTVCHKVFRETKGDGAIYIKVPEGGRGISYDKGFLSIFASQPGLCQPGTAETPFAFPVPAELATHTAFYGGVPDWSERFDDEEDTFALNRWGWLLMLGAEKPSSGMKTFGVEVMRDWSLKMGHRKESPAWESYSVAERIVNCILFLYSQRGLPPALPEELGLLEDDIMEMGRFLLARLEFKGTLTNNHILNDARALYILGAISGWREGADMGRRIFIEETPRMITQSGFLREGSSSYHVLLLRTYLEVLWAAGRSGDDEFAERLRPTAEAMIRAAWFFIVDENSQRSEDLPLIGDVSPDFPPRWLEKICLSRPALRMYAPAVQKADLATGWNGLWQADAEWAHPVRSAEPEEGARIFHDSGWFRIGSGDIVLLSYVCPYGTLPAFSHLHNDLLSFVLYWKGRKVFTDAGRFSYKDEPLGLYGKSAASHNTYMVDGLEPYPVPRTIYPAGYKNARSDVEYRREGDENILKMSHTGFCRIDPSIVASREFRLTDKALVIKDSVRGSGIHTVTTFFHIADGIETAGRAAGAAPLDLALMDDRGIVRMRSSDAAEERGIRKISGKDAPGPAGWYFPGYGARKAIDTVVIEERSSLPYLAEYRLTFEGK
ncbi:MAG: heparinase II/III-family protein [Candidatus Omnitrophota bacterium]